MICQENQVALVFLFRRVSESSETTAARFLFFFIIVGIRKQAHEVESQVPFMMLAMGQPALSGASSNVLCTLPPQKVAEVLRNIQI